MNGSARILILKFLVLLITAMAVPRIALAQPSAEALLGEAGELIGAFTGAGDESIPTELLERARGIAIVPDVFRGGFILGARRGRGVLSLRMPDGSWSNPAFITLTGGSIGWQIGAESTDVVLIFANDSAVKNMASGKFTLGGEASAIAGPMRRQASTTMTFRAEVYGYLRSRGLYAGAAFQGARLKIDEAMGDRFYAGASNAIALMPSTAATPPAARLFLETLDRTVGGADLSPPVPHAAPGDRSPESSAARTFPLPD